MWSKIVQLKVIEEDPDMLYFKYSHDSDYEKCKFKTTNTRHVEMSRTAKSLKKELPWQRRKIYLCYVKTD